LSKVDSVRTYFLYADGHDWDPAQPYWRYDPLQQLGRQTITKFPADTHHIRWLLDSLDNVVETPDTVFIYAFGHGGIDASWLSPWKANHSNLQVRVDSSSSSKVALWDTTFGRYIDELRGTKIVVLAQCYSGGFVDDLTGPHNVVIASAREHKRAWLADNRVKNGSPPLESDVLPGQDSIYHSEFGFHFFNALRGHSVFPYDTLLSPAIPADSNGDGSVSFYEALRYDDEHNSQEGEGVYQEASQYWNYPREQVPVIRPGPNRRVKKGGCMTVAHDAADTLGQEAVCIFKGGNTREFFSYYPASGKWSTRDTIPNWPGGNKKKVNGGASLVGVGSKVYALKGNNTCEFWRYDPAGTGQSKWEDMPPVPFGPNNKTVGDGSCAAAVQIDGTDYIYLLKGKSTREFYRFNCSSNTWETLDQAPGGTPTHGYRAGSSVASGDGDTLYVLKGSYNEFYAYSSSTGLWSTLEVLPFAGLKKGMRGRFPYFRGGLGRFRMSSFARLSAGAVFCRA